VNEIQLIRQQLDTEREHAGCVARACAAVLGRAGAAPPASGSPLEAFRQACVDYLVCVLAWFEERDRRLGALINSWGPEHPKRDALDEALARRGRSRDALERLEAAFAQLPGAEASRNLWAEFAHFLHGPWSSRRDALDALLAASPRSAEWRQVSGIDADGILEERARYARIEKSLPAGVSLAPPPVLGA
jgi:hypothetical protein